MDNTTTTPEYLFESSWEVCNKVGGIYTVLSTKAHTLQRSFKDKLIFIGPDVWTDTNAVSYTHLTLPTNREVSEWIRSMRTVTTTSLVSSLTR